MAIELDIQKNFKGFSLDVKLKGQAGTIGILGASGSGKSMTLRSIAGIETPDSGRIIINGKTVFDSEAKINLKPQERRVGYLFQNYALFPTMTVEKNIACGYRGGKSELSQKVADYIKRYPLEGLKDILQRDMQNFLKDYKGDMLMVTHSRDEAYKFCSQLNLLNNGKDILTGETRDIFENPQYLEAARLTGCKNFSAVQKMGSHEVYALDWELMLRSEQEVTEDITHVGIRGHWMRPADEAGENTMEVQVEEYIENTFEHQYLFRNKGAAESGTLWWMCQKKNFQETAKDNIPKYLYFPPEHVMLLKK